MLDQISHPGREPVERNWPDEGLTRVPYWIFQDQAIYAAEQRRIFQGPSWNYLCLAVEVKNTGDFITTFVGDTSVIVARDADGELYAFENRCAHRGALIALEQRGNTKDFSCVYHAWTYDRQGNLKGVAFKDGIKGKGGMPASFCMEQHNPRKLRLAEAFGIVFGSFSNDVPALEEYLGEEIHSRIDRVHGRAHAGRARPLHAGAAEQLEALYGERQGLLPREHPASVLHHLRAEPAVADGRHHRRSHRRPSRQLFGDR